MVESSMVVASPASATALSIGLVSGPPSVTIMESGALESGAASSPLQAVLVSEAPTTTMVWKSFRGCTSRA
jgi:hypothetical protein